MTDMASLPWVLLFVDYFSLLSPGVVPLQHAGLNKSPWEFLMIRMLLLTVLQATNKVTYLETVALK